MKNTEHAQLLRELGRFCENSPLEGAIDLAGRAYTAAAEEIEGIGVKNTNLARLLRELAQNVKSLRGDLSTFVELNDDYFDRTEAMIAHARLAAEEIEGRREMPTVDEIGRLILFRASHRSAARAILALFGGVEVKS